MFPPTGLRAIEIQVRHPVYTAVQMRISVSAVEPTLRWKRKTTMTYYTHILTGFLKLKVAAYIKNTAFLYFPKRKMYFCNRVFSENSKIILNISLLNFKNKKKFLDFFYYIIFD